MAVMCLTKIFRTTSLKSKRYDGCKDAAVVLFSGGQDSTTCFILGEKQFKTVYALSFVYGQKHVHEVELARGIAERAGWNFMMDVSLLVS